MGRQSDDRSDRYGLRFGVICNLFYRDILEERSVPKQIDLLDTFFPGLAVWEADGNGFPQFPAIYDDQRRAILAVRQENGKFQLNTTASTASPESRRVTQILGRLCGTAKGSQEKERAAAVAMQKRMASDLCHNPEMLLSYRDHIAQCIYDMEEDQLDRFCELVPEFMNGVIDRRESQTAFEKESEPFPIDDEVFDETMHTVYYQWLLNGNHRQNDPDMAETDDLETTANAFTWLLLLSLLRNECRRLIQTYLSTFQLKSPYQLPQRGILYTETDDPELIGKVEDLYTGNDLDKRFPGIEWFCDRCGEYLNIQPCFDDHLPEWKCKKCGYVNRISLDEIYDTDAARQNGEAPVDRDSFAEALRKRKEELE